VFAHEVCHILTYEMLNPQQMDFSELRPNLLLNEGLSEFFATIFQPEVLQHRAVALLGGKTAGGMTIPPAPIPNLAELLSLKAYPRSGLQILPFTRRASW